MHVMDSETLLYKYIKLAVKESSSRRFLVYYAWEQDPVWFRLNATIEEMFADEAPVEPRRRILIGVSAPCSCPPSSYSPNSSLAAPWSYLFLGHFQSGDFEQFCSLGGVRARSTVGSSTQLSLF